MIDVKSYLGQWLDEDPPKGKDTSIECVNVDEQKGVAIFADGQQIKLQDLDLLYDRYSKIKPLYEEPSIAASLGAQSASISSKAAPSDILGDLSKIGNRERNSVSSELREAYNVESKDGPIGTTGPREYGDWTYPDMGPMPDDPIGIFITSAIKISKKAGKKSTIPIKLNLELDFDILGIIESAMKLGATDIEILQHILKCVNINPEIIKKLIAEELLQSPEDAAIVIEKREETFANVLTEELNKHTDDNTNEISDVQSIERYDEKE